MELNKIIQTIGNNYKAVYNSINYTIGFSSAAGLGNGLGNLQQENNFSDGFGQGYINHFQIAFFTGFAYTYALKHFRDSKHSRLYSNLFHAGISSGFLIWHYIIGTENPIQTILPPATFGFMMVNNNVSKDALEKRV